MRIDRLILSVALSSEREKELYKDFRLLCFLVSPVFHISPLFLLVLVKVGFSGPFLTLFCGTQWCYFLSSSFKTWE